MRHALFFGLVVLYVVVVGQNWAHYTAALLAHLWIRYDGDLGAVPVTIGGGPTYSQRVSVAAAMPSGSVPASNVLTTESDPTSSS